jgi:two-component system sensor histidine kinase ChvG
VKRANTSRIPLSWVLFLPCLVLLMVPVAGLLFISHWDVELKSQYRENLQKSAATIAGMLEANDEFLNYLEVREGGHTEGLYSVRLPGPLVLDGRRGDWPNHVPAFFNIDQLLEIHFPYTAESLTYQLSTGTDGTYLYLFYEVTDDVVVYREVNNLSVHRNDHVKISMLDPEGSFVRYTIATIQPAEVTAAIVAPNGRALRSEAALEGRWLATEQGYNVEIRLPLRLLGSRFSTVVVDVDDPDSRDVKYVMGASQTRDVAGLGRLFFSPVAVERWVSQVALGRVEVSDLKGRVILDSSGEADSSTDIQDEYRSEASSEITKAGFLIGTVKVVGSEQFIDELTTRNRELLALFSGALFVAGLLITLLVSTGLIRRLRRISTDFDAMADAQGRVTASPVIIAGGGDELDRFVASLATTVKRIGQYNDYLERMASRLNHELRTPVSVVKSSLEILSTDGEEQSIYVERAKNGIARLTRILNKMSEARRLEEALDEDEIIGFDLGEVVRGCVAGYQLAYPDTRFVLSVETGNVAVTGIPELIAQLLDKVIDNAVEFSSNNEVKVRLTVEQKSAVLRVFNDGPVLPDRETEILFDSMISIRGESGTSEHYSGGFSENSSEGTSEDTSEGTSEGTSVESSEGSSKEESQSHLGLGLYIAKIISEFHGGTLKIANREDTNGVVVTLKIPLFRITARL